MKSLSVFSLRFALAALVLVAAITAIELTLDALATFHLPEPEATSRPLGAASALLAFPLLALPLLHLAR